MEKIKVAVLMGGKSAEREISLKTGQAVVEHLDREKYDIFPFEVPSSGKFSLPPKTDLIFIALHGPYGEDGTIQGLLEMLGIPYTGSGVLASALGIDKIVSRQLFSSLGLTVPKSLVFSLGDDYSSFIRDFSSFISFPCVVKPHNQGSSVGVSLVEGEAGLKEALALALSFPRAKALVEEYLSGREVTCGILGNSGAQPYCLPLTEITPQGQHRFFDWQAKYQAGESEEITPAPLAEGLAQRVRQDSLQAYEALGAQGLARVDGILVGESFYLLEINTIPGMTEISLLPQQARAAGLSFSNLLNRIIQLALETETP